MTDRDELRAAVDSLFAAWFPTLDTARAGFAGAVMEQVVAPVLDKQQAEIERLRDFKAIHPDWKATAGLLAQERDQARADLANTKAACLMRQWCGDRAAAATSEAKHRALDEAAAGGFFEDDEPVGKIRVAYERGTKGQTFPMDLPGFEADDDGCAHRCDHGPEWTHAGCTLRVNPAATSSGDEEES